MTAEQRWPVTGPLGRDGARTWLSDLGTRHRLQSHLNNYFSDDDPSAGYSGRFFEVFRARSEHRDRFCPHDVLAAESLTITIPSETVDWLLQPDARRDDLLSKCVSMVDAAAPVDLWSCDEEWLSDTSPFSQLYETLRRPGLGPTKRSKLLATKLPSIVPIRDSLVAGLLGLESSHTWWVEIRHLLNAGDTPIWQTLESLSIPPGAPDVTALRRLDVVLWMEARSRGLGRRRYNPTKGND